MLGGAGRDRPANTATSADYQSHFVVQPKPAHVVAPLRRPAVRKGRFNVLAGDDTMRQQ